MITYFDERFPSWSGRLKNNRPIFGQGICYLYNTDTLFKGKFDGNSKYTITESDGVHHENIMLDEEREST